jgi:hypothetical protein
VAVTRMVFERRRMASTQGVEGRTGHQIANGSFPEATFGPPMSGVLWPTADADITSGPAAESIAITQSRSDDAHAPLIAAPTPPPPPPESLPTSAQWGKPTGRECKSSRQYITRMWPDWNARHPQSFFQTGSVGMVWGNT